MVFLSSNKILIRLSGFFSPIFEVFKSIPREKVNILIFLIIPLIYLLNASVLHYYQGKFFLGTVDPEYFYVYNGVVLSDGNLSLQYIAHPGIPLQYLVAVSSEIISLFQPGEKIKDFIDDPEKYIHAANLLMNVLIAIVLFFCGLKSKKYSGSYFTGILFQLSPFGSAALLGLSRRLIPESIMIIPLLLTALMVMKNIYDENKNSGRSSDIVLFGIIIGFGIACKLSFLPILAIPLVLLKISITQKLKLILYTTLFFAIFAYPVVFNFSQFWQWASGILIHTGKHGGGETGFIDLTSIPGNIKILFDADRGFFFISLLSLVLSGLFSLKYFRKKGFSNSTIVRAIIAFNMAILICVVFTLKHFAPYYFMPFYAFKYLLILLMVILILQYRKISGSKRMKTIAQLTTSVIILYMTIAQAGQVRASITELKQRNDLLQQQHVKITSLVEKDRPVIMSSPYYGSPFIEFAHFNGYIMTGHLRHCFTPYLKEKFPFSYQFVTWNDKFYFWGDLVDFNSILDKTKTSFYVYIGKGKGSDLSTIEDRIWKVLDKNKVTKRVLYNNDETEEELIEYFL
jgi:hypothetical protein